MPRMWNIVLGIFLLVVSNVLMTFAWYGFLNKNYPMWVSILLSWGVAFFEYCVLVPANRILYGCHLQTGQLKIIQEFITLSVFVPFMLFYMGESWKWDYLWAFLCVMGAVFFVNREALMASFMS